MTRDEEIDHIYDVIDELMWESKFEAIGLMLKYLDPNRSLDILLSFLTITLPVKNHSAIKPYRDEVLLHVGRYNSSCGSDETLVSGL